MTFYQFWTIECRTGCSCCSNEDHYYGIYTKQEDAVSSSSWLFKTKHLASQYASNGVYRIVPLWGQIYAPYNVEIQGLYPDEDLRVALYEDPECTDFFEFIYITREDLSEILVQDWTFSLRKWL